VPFSFIPNKKQSFLLYSMIQGITVTAINANLSTEDNRIDTSVASTQIRYLFKFTNDMKGNVVYCYPTMPTGIYERYTRFNFTWAAVPDMFQGSFNLLPAGHWTYEVYEVSWIGTVTVSSGNAPATETDVLSPADEAKGVVQGIVTKGILNLTEKDGTQQVQYTQRQAPDTDNYIYYGQ
jgi:hypothetical protein